MTQTIKTIYTKKKSKWWISFISIFLLASLFIVPKIMDFNNPKYRYKNIKFHLFMLIFYTLILIYLHLIKNYKIKITNTNLEICTIFENWQLKQIQWNSIKVLEHDTALENIKITYEVSDEQYTDLKFIIIKLNNFDNHTSLSKQLENISKSKNITYLCNSKQK